MIHISLENWTAYARGALDEETRAEYESHLYSCDQCLELYMQAVEEVESQLPVLSHPSGFTDSVMEELSGHQEVSLKKPPQPRKSRKKQALIHYMVAAAMTLCFMATGAFSQFANVMSTIENVTAKQDESVITGWLQTSDSLTERLEEDSKEGTK